LGQGRQALTTAGLLLSGVGISLPCVGKSEDLVRRIGEEKFPALLRGGTAIDIDEADREPKEWLRTGATTGVPPDECVRTGGAGVLFVSHDLLPDSVRLTGGVTGKLPAV
jgi:hypothetical protein